MFGNHGLCGLLEEGGHGKSPKCLGGNLGDFGEFCKGLNMLIEACQFNGKLIVKNNIEIMEFWSKYADGFLYGVEQPYGQDFFKPIRDVIGKLQLEM